MKRPATTGTAAQGVAHIQKIVAAANSIFHPIHQENDVGIDGIIEFVVEGRTTGCCVGVQIKSGESYLRNDRFFLNAGPDHISYWRKHLLPIAGIIYDPRSDGARWVDLTEETKLVKLGVSTVFFAESPFDASAFPSFLAHFRGYVGEYSNDTSFARALIAFSRKEDVQAAYAALRSLFSFHRNRPETWFYLLAALRLFREHPLLRQIVVALAHVPGHPDIFWGPTNTLSKEAQDAARPIFADSLGRDEILTLIGAIDENGIGRGTIGQCVDAIVQLCPNREQHLESIALDRLLDQETHFRACLLLISSLQWTDKERCIAAIERILPGLEPDPHECIEGLLGELRKGIVDFY